MLSAENFNSEIEKMRKDQDSITDGIGDCLDKYEEKRHCLPPWAVDGMNQVCEVLKELRDTWNSFLNEAGQLLSPGWPFWFLEAADAWNEVQRQTSGQILTLQLGSTLPATKSWTGAEGATYRDMPVVQTAALQSVSNFAVSLSSHVSDHGVQLIDYWSQIVEKYLKGAALVLRTVSKFLTADPQKWLNIVQDILDSVADIIEFVGEILTMISNQWTKTITAMHTLKRDMSNLSGTIGGKWPTIEALG